MREGGRQASAARTGPRGASLLLAAIGALAGGCASTGGEKGRMAPLELPRAEIDAAHAPRRIALVAGIDAFDDAAWGRLRYPRKDAADLARVLRAKGGFDQVEVVSESVTAGALRAALDRLAELDRDERDVVLVFLSTHGTLARDGRGELKRYLVARDTAFRDVSGTGIAVEEVKRRFDALRSRRKVLVLAACHSGGGKSLLPEDVQRELAGTKGPLRPIEEVSRATVVLAASDWGETAREDERLQNDIYTHFLVEALETGADRNGDGAVTASEAHDYARHRTYEFTEGRQRPTAESAEVGVDPIVLAGKVERRGRPELYSYSSRLDGFTLSVDDRPLAELPGGAAVAPGWRRVQLAKGSAPPLLSVPVDLAPGERVDLESLAARAEPRFEIAPRIAFLGFLDAASRRDVLGPVLGAGTALTLRGWPARSLSLRLDFLGAAGRGSFAQSVAGQLVGTAAYDYVAFTAGASLPWRWQPLAARGLYLLAGPRLSVVHLHRRFESRFDAAPTSSLLTVMPGLLAGAGWDVGRRFTLGFEVQLDYAMVQVDGRSRPTGFFELLLGAGFRL